MLLFSRVVTHEMINNAKAEVKLVNQICGFCAVLKVSKLTESRTAAGMLFQTAGAETAKECL